MRNPSGEHASSGMARRIRDHDWTATPLGAAKGWSKSLRSAVDLMLGCGFPAVLWAGPGATILYNDAYHALLDGRDDLGRAGLGLLDLARGDLTPALERAWRGHTTTLEDHPLPLLRAGVTENRCFTMSCSPVRDEDRQVSGALLILVETAERVGAGQPRNLMVAELQHRVRNILAVIRSIVGRTAETSQTVEDLSAHLDGRLAALARTQVLLTRGPGAGVGLEDLVHDELLAQVADEGRIGIEGHEILLPPRAAEVMTLVVHELATNATKYGALASGGGRIDIDWSVASRDGADWLRFRWRESGVKIAAAAPRRRGFGTVLIEQRVPYELMGAGALTFAPGGVCCEIAFPLTPAPGVLQTDAG